MYGHPTTQRSFSKSVRTHIRPPLCRQNAFFGAFFSAVLLRRTPTFSFGYTLNILWNTLRPAFPFVVERERVCSKNSNRKEHTSTLYRCFHRTFSQMRVVQMWESASRSSWGEYRNRGPVRGETVKPRHSPVLNRGAGSRAITSPNLHLNSFDLNTAPVFVIDLLTRRGAKRCSGEAGKAREAESKKVLGRKSFFLSHLTKLSQCTCHVLNLNIGLS